MSLTSMGDTLMMMQMRYSSCDDLDECIHTFICTYLGSLVNMISQLGRKSREKRPGLYLKSSSTCPSRPSLMTQVYLSQSTRKYRKPEIVVEIAQYDFSRQRR